MMKTKLLFRTLAGGAAALLVVGGLAACSSAPSTATANGAAEAMLEALADGDAPTLAALTGLEPDKPEFTLLGLATERISGGKVTTEEPPEQSPDSIAQATVGVSYTLAGETVETTFGVERAPGENSPWSVSPPLGTVTAPSAEMPFAVADKAPVGTATLLPGVYPITVQPLAFVTTPDSVTVTAPDTSVGLGLEFDSEGFTTAANEFLGDGISQCITGIDSEGEPSTSIEGVTCSGKIGLEAGDDNFDPRHINWAFGELIVGEVPSLVFPANSSPSFPTVDMNASGKLAVEQDVTATWQPTPRISNERQRRVAAETEITATVKLNAEGIESIDVYGFTTTQVIFSS